MKLLLLLLGLTAVAAEPRLTAGALVLELDAQGRAVWFGRGTNLLPSPRPFCLVTKGGKSLPAERLTVAGSRWTFTAAGATVTLRVEPREQQIEIALEAVSGDPDEVVLAELTCLPGAEAGPHGLIRYPDRAAGLVAANPRTRVRTSLGKQGSAIAAVAYRETGYEGARAYLFEVPTPELPAAVARVEQAAGIPLGIAAKQGEANRGSYLMISGVTQANADQVVDWARRGRFGSVLLLHGTWGDYRHGYAVPTRYFPDGIAGLKQVVDKFHAAGVLVGAHCFATKLPKNADRMHPVPDKRLYQDLTTALAEPLEAGTTDIVVSDELTAWPRTTGTRDLLIGDELVIYESCSDGPPWTFRNCQRGAYGTTAASHPRAARVGRLFTDEARNIWVIDPRTTLLEEHAADLAATYNAAGFDWIYFDGAEDVPPPYWLNVSLAKLAVLNKLARPPVTVESAAHGAFCWHLDTRTGQRDYFWVSPSPKDEADDALLTSVPSARRQFMVPNIGWFPISNGRRGRTPLDDVEAVFGKAAATDSVVSVLTSVGELGSHPHLDALLDLIGRYERLRLERRLDEPTRQLLLRENREAMLVVDEAGNEQVVKAREMPFVAGDGRAVRCLLADPVAGVRTCSLFNVDQPVALDLSLDPRRVSFVDHRGEPVTVEQRPGARLVVPVRGRVLMKCRGIAGGDINMALRGARVTPLPMEAIWLRAGEAVDLQPGLTLVEPGLGADVFGRLLTATAPGPNGPTASASYHLSLPRAGTYRLYARVMSADTSSNSFWLTPPGGEPLVLGNVMTDYGSWVWAPPLELTLPAGPVVLKIGNRESQAGRSPLLSLLCLVPATSGEVPDDRQARIALTP